jgi:hypothetical protein
MVAVLMLAGLMTLAGCGGSSSGNSSPNNVSLSGNWQFTMAPPHDGSFTGGLQGGFLLESGGTVKGATEYAVLLPQLLIPCSTGSAAVTGTVSGQTVQLTAVAGTQIFTLSGTISLDGSTMSGTYTSTAGTAPDGSPCGTAQSGLQWTAALVPSISGAVTGTFHSAGGAEGLNEQDFIVSGGLTEGNNTGASGATVTGSLTFVNSGTNVSDYACVASASVYGTISGASLDFQIVGGDGSILGQIGVPAGSTDASGLNPVTVAAASGGSIITGAGPNYMVATNSCPGSLGNIATAGDYGTICLALGSVTKCNQPVTLAPVVLTFPAQVIGTPPTTQVITLTNASGAALGGLTLALVNDSGALNFSDLDACGVDGFAAGSNPFALISGQACEITVSFAPQETCAVGTPPDQCPSPLTATLVLTSPNNNMIFTVPMSGTAVSGGLSGAGNDASRNVEGHAASY